MLVEARDRLPGRGVVELPLGFGIRHGPSPGETSATRNPAVIRLSERRKQGSNLPSPHQGDASSSSPSSRRCRPLPKKKTTSRSPLLPAWYPRTPLRDITHIVRAIERRSIRVKVAAELRRRKQGSEDTPVSPIPLTSPLAQLSTSEESPLSIQASLSTHHDVAFHSTPMKNKTLNPADKHIEEAPSSLPLSDANTHRDHLHAKFRVLEEMEKAVKEKLQTLSQAQPRKQPVRSIFMSMR